MFVSQFRSHRPEFQATQDVAARWLAGAQVAAHRAESPLDADASQQLRDERETTLLGVCGWPDRIHSRASFLGDFMHEDFSSMEVYRLDESARGQPLSGRMRRFEQIALQVFEELFEPDEEAPEHLLHVTCTGYASPSAAQRLAAGRDWCDTAVTHLYHMGCHAAVPALRTGRGLLAAEPDARAEVVHTELCTLHFDPRHQDMEQLVVQSLFADGVIRYRLTSEQPMDEGLEVLAIAERLVPDTAEAMTWVIDDHGMAMTLSRDVPRQIRRSVGTFLSQLAARAGLSTDDLSRAWYAVHPGGPLIVDMVAKQLELSPEQVRHSNEVLRRHGNMSSATLPHIWEAMLAESPAKRPPWVVSLAFGPGLTICGVVMRVCE